MRALLALVAVAAVARADVRAAPPLPAFTERLPNGLTVVLAPDPNVTSVVVHVRYHGGAADETPAQAGYTNLVERLFAAGSVHVKPGQFDALIEDAGGWSSSTTDTDHLSVFEQVPTGALELALFLEAERMAGLADGIRDEELAKAKDALAAEYRAAYVERPYGLVAKTVQEELWRGLPYAHDVLGDGKAVAAATRGSVRAFIKQRIAPNHATLVIAGNHGPSQRATLALVKKYFGWIPRRDVAASPKRAPVEPLVRAVEKVVDDPSPKLVVAYRGPADASPDAIALEVAARVLARRLDAALVKPGLASAARADLVRMDHASELRVEVTPLAGAAPEQLVAAVRDEIAKLRAHKLATGEIAGATAAAETAHILAAENLAFRAELVARAALRLELGTVTREALQTVAHRWLADTAAVTVIGRPRGPR